MQEGQKQACVCMWKPAADVTPDGGETRRVVCSISSAVHSVMSTRLPDNPLDQKLVSLCGTLLLKLSNQPELYRPPRQDQNVSSLGSFPTHVWIESHSRFKGLEKLRETLMKSKTNSYWERILSCSFLQCTSLYSCSTCPELYLQRLWVQVPPEHECDLLSPSRCCYDQGCREVRIHEANL